MSYVLTGEVGGKRSTLALHEGTNPIGRSSGQAEIVLPSPTVSRLHAEILVAGDRVVIRDLGAHNGTLVNGERVAEHPLAAGDEITLGNVVLRFERSDAVRPARFSDDSLLRTAELHWSEHGTSDRALRTRFIETLVELGEYLVGASGEDVYAACLAPVTRLFDFHCACLLIVNDAGEADVRCIHPPGADPSLRVSRSMIDTVIRERRGLLVRDAAQAPLWQTARLKGIQSALVVPLLSETVVIGAIYLDQDDPLRAYDERHLYRLQLIANLVAAKISTTRVQEEMRGAGYMQRYFLCTQPRHPEGYELDFHLEPSAQVAGDLYESLLLPDGRYLYVVGDVTGHGVGAALLMALVLATLRAFAPSSRTPLELAARLREQLAEQLEPAGYVTLFLGFLDPQSHRLVYVNAGHELAAFLAPGIPAQVLDSTGPPIGMRIPVSLQRGAVDFPPGALLCICSDGITEAWRPGSRPPQFFTRERLLRALDELQHAPAAEIVASIFKQVDEFVGAELAQDDRTLLVLRRLAGRS